MHEHDRSGIDLVSKDGVLASENIAHKSTPIIVIINYRKRIQDVWYYSGALL